MDERRLRLLTNRRGLEYEPFHRPRGPNRPLSGTVCPSAHDKGVRLGRKVRVAGKDPAAMLPRSEGVFVEPTPHGGLADGNHQPTAMR